MKRWLVFIVVIVALLAVIVGIKAIQVKRAIAGYAAMPEPSFTVSTAKAEYQTWAPELDAIGTLRAVRGADLSTEVGGLVHEVLFRSGEDVLAGTVLLRLVDDSDVARLHALQATATLAEQNFARDQKQYAVQAISKAALDNSAATLKSARAQVAEQAALVEKKTIRAPFAGRLGISSVNPGQYLNPGDKIITLQKLDPIHVDFSLPQQAIAEVSVGDAIRVVVDAFAGQTFEGKIRAIDPVVAGDTRNLNLRATLDNPKQELLPGMFARVKIATGSPQRYLTLPQTAITFNPYGATVFLVVPRGQENAPDPNLPPALAKEQALDKLDAERNGQGGKPAAAPAARPGKGETVLVARQVFVTTGPTRGDQIAVLSGLKEGDDVVTTGQIKLKNGTRVVINNAVVPTDDPAPQPKDD